LCKEQYCKNLSQKSKRFEGLSATDGAESTTKAEAMFLTSIIILHEIFT